MKSLDEVESEIKYIVREMGRELEILALSSLLIDKLSELLAEWLSFLPKDFQNDRIAILGDPEGEVVKVSELPELIKRRDIRALKIVRALFSS